MSKLRIAGTLSDSIVDGKGLRFVIFTQGCKHNCAGCHNAHTHDFNAGVTVDTDDLFNEFRGNVLLQGVTFSGGEPMEQAAALVDLARRIKSESELDITVFTGYTVEYLMNERDPDRIELLSLTDVLIDGRFVEELRDLTLAMRGSSNQRVIDMNATRKNGNVVTVQTDDVY